MTVSLSINRHIHDNTAAHQSPLHFRRSVRNRIRADATNSQVRCYECFAVRTRHPQFTLDIDKSCKFSAVNMDANFFYISAAVVTRPCCYKSAFDAPTCPALQVLNFHSTRTGSFAYLDSSLDFIMIFSASGKQQEVSSSAFA